jgi:hypothetical protein
VSTLGLLLLLLLLLLLPLLLLLVLPLLLPVSLLLLRRLPVFPRHVLRLLVRPQDAAGPWCIKVAVHP